MNQQTQTPAQQYLADLRARNIVVKVLPTKEPAGTGYVLAHRVQLCGGQQRAGEFEKVHRHHQGLVALLLEQNALGDELGEVLNIAARPFNASFSYDPRLTVHQRYKHKLGDEQIKPEIASPEPIYAKMDESKPRTPSPVPNYAKPLPGPKKRGVTPKERPRRGKHGSEGVDETGKEYGRLTVVRKAPERRSGQLCWECSCSCGGKRTVTGGALRKGEAKSCGCLAREYRSQKDKVGLNRRKQRALEVGETYHEWTVIGHTDRRDAKNRAFVLCECSCGKKREVAVDSLVRKGSPSLSCGHSTKRPTLYDWSKVDLTRSIPSLCKELGCCISSVRGARQRARKQLGQ